MDEKVKQKILVVVIGLLLPLYSLFILTANIEDIGHIEDIIEDTHITISDNSFMQTCPVYLPLIRVLASKVELELVENNTELIDCLIECESGGNTEAVGDNGRANGILQFHLPTFKLFCVNKYGFFESDYKDSLTQRQCCDLMITDGLQTHWSCMKVCR